MSTWIRLWSRVLSDRLRLKKVLKSRIRFRMDKGRVRILNDPALLLRLEVVILLKDTIAARLPYDTSSFALELASGAPLHATPPAACPGSSV